MKAKKSLGQNFLKDKSILGDIVHFSGVSAGEKVLEIGPGQGDLTEALLAAGTLVTALELDSDLIPILEKRFLGEENIRVEFGDVLQVKLEEVILGEYSVIANIPYYITAPIVQKLITDIHPPKSATLLVQKEVAERLGGEQKSRSVLTVATEYYAHVELGPVVPRQYFDPVPKVDSQVVRLTPYRKPSTEDKTFFRVVKVGFAARRKTLFNNLVAGRLASKEEVVKIFTDLQWAESRRAQELTLEEWLTLASLFR